MTVLVGVKCTNGVVIGADSIATSAHGHASLLQTQTDKIQIIADQIIVAGSGSVGLIQRFNDVVNKLWHNNLFQQETWACLRAISANTIKDFQSTGVPQKQPPHGLGFLGISSLTLRCVLVGVNCSQTQTAPSGSVGLIRETWACLRASASETATSRLRFWRRQSFSGVRNSRCTTGAKGREAHICSYGLWSNAC